MMDSGQKGLVGFMGLGNIGAPMAARLLDMGYRVIGYDVKPETGEALRGRNGFSRAEHPSEVHGAARIVLLSLPSSRQVEEVLIGPDGIAASGGAIRFVLDTSTSIPASTRRLSARLRDAGIRMIDAPISGGLARARDGRLTVMAGGEADDLEFVRPLLECLGTVHHLGPAGSGHVAKLVNNLILGVNMAVLSEGLSLGEAAGLDMPTLVEVIKKSTGASQVLEARGWRLVDRDFERPQATLSILHKELGVAMPIGAAAVQLYRIGMRLGFGEQDYAAVARVYEHFADADK
jgi:3-hydroxyisobutyrate dehydrogenase-like beta-hydroxyacid dehydrogenase